MAFFSPASILTHFQTYLPRVTDKFSTNVSVSAEIADGDPQVLAVNETSHGLTEGTNVLFRDGVINNNIIGVQLFTDTAGNVLRFTTQTGHDLTQDYNTESVTLSGFTDTGLNGTFSVIAVPSRTTFEIEYDTLPTLTGSEVLTEEWELGLNGVFEVSTVVDADNYTIDLTGYPEFTPGDVPVLTRVTELRMSVALDAERANASYTKQSDDDSLWLYIVMGDATASKSRDSRSDAVNNVNSQNVTRVTFVNTFSVLVFFPTSNQTLGGTASTQAWDEILRIMLKVGSSAKFDTFDVYDSLTTMTGHGSSQYLNGYYVHAYEFEYNYQTTNEEGFNTNFPETRAFRDIGLDLFTIAEGSTINLDEEVT